MKGIFTLVLVFICAILCFGQNDTLQTRGVAPKKKPAEKAAKQTWAVVVGISDYESDQIPDLKYAHKDAEQFVDYLKSTSGGAIPESHIKTLLNEDATKGQVCSAFDWMKESCQKGDKVVIYFSGHGDVETTLDKEEGFLLTYDTSPNNYVGGAFKLSWLQEIVSELSTEKDAKVIVISDACRSGNLAGKSINGSALTASVLAQQFSNETKILSCQPDELSVEGNQWGGGRGCFSYHLLEGLNGKADADKDAVISLFEIEKYLEDFVPKEAAPISQIPFTIGNKKTKLFNVSLANRGKSISKSRGGAASFVSGDNFTTESKNIYEQFTNALKDGNLLFPENQSAEFYYKKLLSDPSLRSSYQDLTDQWKSSLLDEAQGYINMMLQGDPILIDDYIKSQGKDLSVYPEYLSRLSKFYGEGHFLYTNIKMLENYFLGVAVRERIRKENLSIEEKESLNQEALAFYQVALQLDSTAAFVHLGLSSVYKDLNQGSVSLKYADKAIEYAPTWALAKAFKGLIYSSQNDKQAALALYEEAYELDDRQIQFLQWMINDYKSIGKIKEANQANEMMLSKIKQTMEKSPNEVPDYYKSILAVGLSESGEYEEAANMFEALDKDFVGGNYNLLHSKALNLYRMQKYEEALSVSKESIKVNATAMTWLTYALINMELSNMDDAKMALKKAKRIDKNYAHLYYCESKYFRKLNKDKKVVSSLEQAFELEPLNSLYTNAYLQEKLMDISNRKDGDELFAYINDKNPENFEVLKKFAIFYKRIGEGVLAKEMLLRAIESKRAN